MIETNEPDRVRQADVRDAMSRRPHAVLDLESRRRKACKIERLLDLQPGRGPMRLLEVGTGSGGIAHYFGTHPRLQCEVDAVDVHDNRLVTDGYRYHQVASTRLPFADGRFDVVLTNHVIEHVGDALAQRAHLSELHRVLKPGGIGYLAVPNRWMLVEPHFNLAFLSWLPRGLRSPYVRAMRKGEAYDCEPLQMRQLERLLSCSGFDWSNRCIEALRTTLEIEGKKSVAAGIADRLPDAFLRLLLPVVPTLIYTFRRGAGP